MQANAGQDPATDRKPSRSIAILRELLAELGKELQPDQDGESYSITRRRHPDGLDSVSSRYDT